MIKSILIAVLMGLSMVCYGEEVETYNDELGEVIWGDVNIDDYEGVKEIWNDELGEMVDVEDAE